MKTTRRRRQAAPDGTPALGTGAKAGAAAVALGAAAFLAYLWAAAPPRLGPDLCPVRGDSALPVTVLLIDPSTPLEAKHREELVERLMREMGTPGTPMHIPVGGRVAGYHLPPVEAAFAGELAAVDVFCNPGGRPEDRRWVDNLVEGWVPAEHRWEQFTGRLERLFPEEHIPDQGGTPLLETLALLSARYAHSAREEGGRRMHLVLWSDLLQNSPYLTQYDAGRKYDAEAWLENPANAHLRSDMRGVDASVFRLERPGEERFQTDGHFRWWAEVLTGMGATIRWQESI